MTFERLFAYVLVALCVVTQASAEDASVQTSRRPAFQSVAHWRHLAHRELLRAYPYGGAAYRVFVLPEAPPRYYGGGGFWTAGGYFVPGLGYVDTACNLPSSGCTNDQRINR